MSNNENQIYIKSAKQWVTVDEEFCKDYYRGIDTFRRKQQRHGRCCCPCHRWWLCDTNCEDCEFRKAGDQLSLEAEMIFDEGATSLEETIPDPSLDIEEALVLADTIDALHQELNHLDPEGQRICQLIMEGKSERESARILGLPWSTYKRHWDKIKVDLYNKLRNYI